MALSRLAGKQQWIIISFTVAAFPLFRIYCKLFGIFMGEWTICICNEKFLYAKQISLSCTAILNPSDNPAWHIKQPFLHPVNWLTRSNLQTIQYCSRLDLTHHSKGLFIFQMSYPARTNDVAAWHQVLNKLWTEAIHSTLWLQCNVYSTIKILFSIQCR